MLAILLFLTVVGCETAAAVSVDFTCRPDLAETAAPPEGPAEPDPATPADTGPAIETYEGYAQLTWQPADAPQGDLAFELQQSRDASFASPRVIYKGRDLASLVSGLPDGTTWYRVRALQEGQPAGPWSPPLPVTVTYPAAGKAVAGLIVGAVVLAATVATVVGGHLATKNQNPAQAA